jgi:hypothetical protein
MAPRIKQTRWAKRKFSRQQGAAHDTLGFFDLGLFPSIRTRRPASAQRGALAAPLALTLAGFFKLDSRWNFITFTVLFVFA